MPSWHNLQALHELLPLTSLTPNKATHFVPSLHTQPFVLRSYHIHPSPHATIPPFCTDKYGSQYPSASVSSIHLLLHP